MAENGAVVKKAAAVREVMSGAPDMPTADVIAEVKKRFNLEVTSQSVYQERKKMVPEVEVPKALEGVEALLAVKDLADKVGGIEALESLLATYKKLKS